MKFIKRLFPSLLLGIVLLSFSFFAAKFVSEQGKIDFFMVFFIGSILSSIELGSRYKDEPISVVTCAPGICYIFVNGLICCVGLFFIKIYGNPQTVTEGKKSLESIQVTDILYASLGSFLVMRSSFLKLGSDSSQIDLGLNAILKKMVDMIDRQVDRDQASRRSKDITDLLHNVEYEDLADRVKPMCIQVMQNVSPEELENLLTELKTIESSDDNIETRKLSMGLELYNIVGKKVLESVVRDLKLPEKIQEDPTPPAHVDRQDSQKKDFEKYFGNIVDVDSLNSAEVLPGDDTNNK